MNKKSNGERSTRKLKVSIETVRRLTDLQSGQVVGGWVKTEGW
jgi:hypothetical protein